MAFVYILKSLSTGKYYIGSSRDAKSRIKQHFLGKVFSTKKWRPLRTVLVQEYKTITDARKIENKLKKLKRKDYLDKIVREEIIKMGP